MAFILDLQGLEAPAATQAAARPSLVLSTALHAQGCIG
jgi:hypothetical protein